MNEQAKAAHARRRHTAGRARIVTPVCCLFSGALCSLLAASSHRAHESTRNITERGYVLREASLDMPSRPRRRGQLVKCIIRVKLFSTLLPASIRRLCWHEAFPIVGGHHRGARPVKSRPSAQLFVTPTQCHGVILTI